MKKIWSYCVLLTLVYVFVGCSSSGSNSADAKNPTREELKVAIKEMEDSLLTMSSFKSSGSTLSLSQQELINRLTTYYRYYPEDPFSAECLFKVQMLYANLNAHRKSIAYGDTVLMKFPNYNNRNLVIESNIATLDVFIEPRDTAAIRKYYMMLLSDSNYPSAKKNEIKRRLSYLHLTIFEYANLPKNVQFKK